MTIYIDIIASSSHYSWEPRTTRRLGSPFQGLSRSRRQTRLRQVSAQDSSLHVTADVLDDKGIPATADTGNVHGGLTDGLGEVLTGIAAGVDDCVLDHGPVDGDG